MKKIKEIIKDWIFIAKVFKTQIFIFIIVALTALALLQVLNARYSFTIVMSAAIIYLAIVDWIGK